jgi:hypothetical protein
VTLDGTFAFKKANGTFQTEGGTPFDADYLAIGASIDDAFVGVNGLGLSLGVDGDATKNIEVGVLLVTDAGGNKYTAVKASAAEVSFTGIPGLEATVTSATLAMNKTTATDANAVLDFDPTTFALPGTSLVLDFDGAEGALIEAQASMSSVW